MLGFRCKVLGLKFMVRGLQVEGVGFEAYRGASLMRKRSPPKDPPRTLGIGLRQGPRGV